MLLDEEDGRGLVLRGNVAPEFTDLGICTALGALLVSSI